MSLSHPTVLPPLADLIDSCFPVELPLHTRFRGVVSRQAALFRGAERWSEFAPFLEYPPAEAAHWLAAAIEYGWSQLPTPLRTNIPVNGTVPAVTPELVPKTVARFTGCEVFKIKVAEPGQDLSCDVARVNAVRREVGEGVQLRLDANGAWDVATALRSIQELARFGLDYVEQPCASVTELAELREGLAQAGCPVKIAADESVRKAADPLRVARLGAADLLVVKAAPLGGISRALAIVSEAGLPVVVSSALDTSVGIGMGLRLAAVIPDRLFYGACGLATAEFLAADVVSSPLTPAGGSIPVDAPVCDPELLSAAALTGQEREKWLRRVTECYKRLETPVR